MSNIIAIILIVASIGTFFGYIDPNYAGANGNPDPAQESITELQSKQQDYTDALNKARDIEVARSGLLAKYNALSADDRDNKLPKLIPDNIDSVRLIIDINTMAAKHGMSLANIVLTASGALPANGSSGGTAPASTVAGPDSSLYTPVTLGFSVAGSYANFTAFLKELEQSLRIVDIVSLSFGQKDTGAGGTSVTAPVGSTDFYTYSMTVRTYYLK